jgi:Flp pilus assembly CpaE family ATPase
LASPQLFSDYRQINPQIVQQVVQFALASYQRVVVELEDLEHSEQVRTLTASHWIVLPLRLDFVALSRTKKCIDHLLNLKVAPERIVVVASRAGRQKEMPVDTCAEVLGLPIDHRIPEDPASVNMAVNLGLPVIDLCPKSAIAANIVKLAGSISGGAKEESKPDRGKWPIPANLAAGFVGLISSCVNAAFTSD